jgi:hypothetical protein
VTTATETTGDHRREEEEAGTIGIEGVRPCMMIGGIWDRRLGGGLMRDRGEDGTRGEVLLARRRLEAEGVDMIGGVGVQRVCV